jgi:hypothetical protein
MLSGMGYPTGKTTRTGTGMGKNLNPHEGMSFLVGRVRISGCGYGIALPDGFLPVAISTPNRPKLSVSSVGDHFNFLGSSIIGVGFGFSCVAN